MVRSGQGQNTVIVKDGQRVRTVRMQGRRVVGEEATDRLGLPPGGWPDHLRRATLRTVRRLVLPLLSLLILAAAPAARWPTTSCRVEPRGGDASTLAISGLSGLTSSRVPTRFRMRRLPSRSPAIRSTACCRPPASTRRVGSPRDPGDVGHRGADARRVDRPRDLSRGPAGLLRRERRRSLPPPWKGRRRARDALVRWADDGTDRGPERPAPGCEGVAAGGRGR